jgi:PAS domain S-box-containing protein
MSQKRLPNFDDPDPEELLHRPRLTKEGTETIDLASLFTADVSTSGSFDIRGNIWATTFGKLIQALPIPAFLIDGEHNILQANQACSRINPKHEAFPGNSFCDFVRDSEAPENLRLLLEEVLVTRKTKVVEAVLSIEGREMWARMTFRSVKIMEDRFVLALIEDLTKEKRQLQINERLTRKLERKVEERTAMLTEANEKLQRAENRYRSLFEKAPLMYVVTRNEQGVPFISDCNELFLESVGCLREEVLGKPLADYYFPESMAELLQGGGYVRALEGEFTIGERQLLTRNGSLIPTLLYTAPEEDSSGRVTGTRAMFVDITERKRAEEAIRKTSRELGERVKELNCLFGLSKLVESPGISLNEILQGVVDLILRAWQYPEITCARINLEGREFETENFADALWKQSADIIACDERIGRLEVGYAEKRPDSDEGPFLIQERQLLDAIAERLGRVAARMKTEEALRESEALYRQLVENLNGIVFSVDTRSVLNYMSPQIERLLGYKPSEILGQPYESFVHEDDIADIADSFTDVLEGRLYPSEFRLRKKSGDYAWVQSSSRPIFKGEQIIGITGIAVDITDRKDVEHKLRESEERYRIFFDTSCDCVFMTTVDGQFADFNGAALEMFGYAPGERDQLLQTNVADVYANREERKAHASLVSKQGFSKEYPVDFRKKDGTIFHSLVTTVARRDPHGTVMGFQGTIRDITDRKRAEEMLIESEERHRALLKGLLDSVPDIVFFKDLAGTYLGCNQRFADFVGRLREEIIGHTDYDLFAKEVADSFRENDRLMLELGEPRRNEEWTDYQDGQRVLVETFKAPLRSFDGKVRGVVGIARDITDRNSAEQRLRESEENFRTFFETLDDLIVVATPEGRITFTNSALKNKLGYREDEIQKMHVLDLHPPDKRQEAEGIFAEMFSGERDSCPLPLERKNGALMPVETRVWFGKWSGADCIFGICKDLSKEQAALQKFNKFFSSNPALMAVTTMAERRFTEVNESFLSTLGYSRKEVVGRTGGELGLFVEPERQQEVAEAILKEGRVHNVELSVKTKDGSLLEGLFSGEIIDNQGEKSLLSVMIDITARKRAQVVLQEREASLRAILNNAPFMMWLKDREGKFLAVNEVFAKSCGRESPDEVTGKTDFDFYPSELAERYRADDREVMTSKVQKSVEEPILDAGETKWVETFKMPILDKDGSVLGTTGFARDITDRKQEHLAEQRRTQEAKRLLAIALEQAAEGVLITDAVGKIEYVNPEFETISGYTGGELLGQNPRMLNSGSSAQANFAELWTSIAKGNAWRGRLANRKKDGALLHLESTISPVRNAEGTIVNYLALMRDVTKELLLEKQLIQAQKMEAIGTLAGGIAHDFNNMIFAITGYTELALEELPKGSQVESDLQRVLHASTRAGDMVKQILTFSRQGQLERKPLDLSPIIKEGLKFLRASIPSTVEIRQHIELGLRKVHADPTQIHQVLMNLCTNASHAMRDGKGVLSVSLSSTQVDSAFAEKHPPLIPGSHVTLTVTDTGYGIPPELMDRIFEPYFTTKPTGEGTGLGLSVLYGIVRSHGGIVTVANAPRQGTTFTVYLPIVEDEEAEDETAASDHVPTGHECILLVDDEQILVEMEQAILERLGYEVVAQTSPVQAVEVFSSDPKRFDLVITDLTMPKMTGVDLAKELTAIRPGVPLILCTGYSEKIEDADAKKLGFGAMIVKPILKKDIAKVIREVLDREE